MYELKTDGQLVVPKGDTVILKVNINGRPFPDGTVAVFGVCNAAKSATVLYKTFPVVENCIVVHLTNADTRMLQAGKYRWDIRLVSNPEYDEDGSVRCDDDSDEVLSVFSGNGNGMPVFEVTEVAASV